MKGNINKVRERLERLANIMSGGRMISSGRASYDISALLADHARLQAVVAKIGDDAPTLCDLCRTREEVRSDAEGIGFCQACWDGWQAEEAKAVQP